MSVNIKDGAEILVTDEGPNVDVLLQEYKQAGVMPNGFYDVAFNQEVRRMIWAGQSPDGRKWDGNMPDGEIAQPWDGSSDTRVPLVDELVNSTTALLATAFERAELRATAVDPDRSALVADVNKYLHWMVHTRYRRMLNLEVELSAQYMMEHGFCIAYVGWERELSKRRVKVSTDDLSNLPGAAGQNTQTDPNASNNGGDIGQPPLDLSGAGPSAIQPNTVNQQGGDTSQPPLDLQGMVMNPDLEDDAVVVMQDLYRVYVTQALAGQGFFDEELSPDTLKLSDGTARKCVRELREEGTTKIPIPYVCRNNPIVWVGQPFLEMMAARGTMELQKSRTIFWRRWMTEAEVRGKEVEGWDKDWIEQAINTKGNISAWAGALGATSLTGPSTKTVGSTTYLKVTEENNPLIEVVYAVVKKVDDDGVTGMWQTIFSPHLTRTPQQSKDFYAKHELLDYAHGRYPFIELKRENIGRALTDTRSTAEIAGTWQNEEKEQRDMLYNRSQWDTLPPIAVPKLGGVDYRLGPGAQVPVGRGGQEIKGIRLDAPPPNLAIELIQAIRLTAKEYFGNADPALDPALTAAKQAKRAKDFYSFWGECLLHMFALTLQYNPMEVARVTGNPMLPSMLDPATVLDEFDFGLEFDVQELNPDYLVSKMKAMNDLVLPADVAGVINRSAWTTKQAQMIDPKLAAQLVQDQATASQKIFEDTDLQVLRMATGNEAKYVENDPSAGMRLQYVRSIVQNNPKYQQWLREDQRFQALMTNYLKNLQMSVAQQQNKLVGRIGVKQVGPGTGPASPGPGLAAPGGIGPGPGGPAPPLGPAMGG